jgi:hypothetical protein
MEYTVIGDNINIGKRVESLSGRWQVFAAKSTYESVKDKCIAIGLPSTLVKGKSYPLKIYSIRGISLSQDEMLLCIPIIVFDIEGTYNQKGIIAGYTTKESRIHITVFSKKKINKGEKIHCKIDIPELSSGMVLEGKVVALTTEDYYNNYLYSKIEISDVTADEFTMSILKPGFSVESEKSWEEIKRR